MTSSLVHNSTEARRGGAGSVGSLCQPEAEVLVRLRTAPLSVNFRRELREHLLHRQRVAMATDGCSSPPPRHLPTPATAACDVYGLPSPRTDNFPHPPPGLIFSCDASWHIRFSILKGTLAVWHFLALFFDFCIKFFTLAGSLSFVISLAR